MDRGRSAGSDIAWRVSRASYVDIESRLWLVNKPLRQI